MRVSPHGTVQHPSSGSEKIHIAFSNGDEISGPTAAPLVSAVVWIVQEEPSSVPLVCLENELQGSARAVCEPRVTWCSG